MSDPTRDELLSEAEALGLRVHGNTKPETIRRMIAEARETESSVPDEPTPAATVGRTRRWRRIATGEIREIEVGSAAERVCERSSGWSELDPQAS